jgi:hypothetical protein
MPIASVKISPIIRKEDSGYARPRIHAGRDSWTLALDERKACLETRRIAAHKLELIECKIADLAKIKKSLASLVRACDASSDGAACPIIHLMAND